MSERQKESAVVFIAHTYLSGLVYHWVHLAGELIKGSHNNSFDMYICSHVQEQQKGSWVELRKKVQLESLISVQDYDVAVYQSVEKLLERYTKVIIHYGGGHNLLKPLKRLKKVFGARIKIVAITQSFRHDHWLRLPVSAYQFVLYKKYVDYVVFQCPYASKQFFGGQWLLNNNRGGCIPLGLEAFTDKEMGERPQEVLGSPDIRDLLEEKDKFNFVFLGEFRPGKGQAWLYDAIRPIMKENSWLRMYYLGGGGVLAESMRAQIKKDGLEDQVICPGHIQRKNIPWILARCHSALIPTRSETFGHCFAEPAMAGLPIIGTRVGAGEYLIQDMLTGIGFTYGNKAGLRAAVRFMATRKDLARKMGDTAREMVKGLFLHTNVARAYISLYEKLLEE